MHSILRKQHFITCNATGLYAEKGGVNLYWLHPFLVQYEWLQLIYNQRRLHYDRDEMKLLSIVLLILLIMLQSKLWSDDGGLKEVWQHRAELELQREESRLRQERNAELEAEVRDLNNGLAAIEERARSELGMIRRGETFIQVVGRDHDFPHGQ